MLLLYRIKRNIGEPVKFADESEKRIIQWQNLFFQGA